MFSDTNKVPMGTFKKIWRKIIESFGKNNSCFSYA